VVGPEANLEAVGNYLESTLERCRQLGAKVAVWGSASSRNVPEGYSRDKAWSEIKTFLARAGEIARSKQIAIGIEPLRKQESNIINTGGEALRLVREVNHPNVKMIIDYYHLRVENEDPEIVREAREHIVHLHFANPEGRRWPKLASEDAEYGRFFRIVKEVGYAGGLSIEGNGTFEADADGSLKFFKEELG
jgi:D-psicose/D-tagatose/L-ribulose 3-epimerase